jgi:hypothetical protein
MFNVGCIIWKIGCDVFTVKGSCVLVLWVMISCSLQIDTSISEDILVVVFAFSVDVSRTRIKSFLTLRTSNVKLKAVFSSEMLVTIYKTVSCPNRESDTF